MAITVFNIELPVPLRPDHRSVLVEIVPLEPWEVLRLPIHGTTTVVIVIPTTILDTDFAVYNFNNCSNVVPANSTYK